jgi:hypothetical protein
MEIDFQSGLLDAEFISGNFDIIFEQADKDVMKSITQAEKGTKVRIRTIVPFTSLDGSPVDPDRVLIGFEVNGLAASKTVFIYNTGSGDSTHTIVRSGLGEYYADIDTSSYAAGEWSVVVACEPTSAAVDTTKTKIRKSYRLVVLDNTFALE